ncbi:class I SAM-dependent methyltransferase [Alkalitalea saponilacus]|uniref:Methyltransferase domain-containing protein n=1 Tax=Alkalitalea saponilacus TaxID=889453 RepID=A0A1T5HTB6_9BACT|nr:class I SAM-dependent methyltransferase [Alkalitalea saponilacus]ASB49205.1 SAM-dependent methyltransferase [Alkalitalea saponilacus]SKC23969.1 Methyltransferase domain-containing protein [Alkalitalea saponilacus]
MNINTNTWNKIRYTFYTPVYDFIAGYIKNSRKKSVDSLDIKAGDKVLIIGAGTGLDLEFLPKDCEVFATDITPSMVERIKKRNRRLNRQVQTIIMDGQALEFADNSFDKIILHLVLAVIPDPIACISESERVLKHGGQIAVFDKFVRKGKKVSSLRRLANVFTNFLFSDITRDFETIAKNSGLTILSDEDANFNGNFRMIKMTKE